MGRRAKYHTQEERKAARREQHSKRSLMPGAKEARCEENRRAYAKRKVIAIPEPSDVIHSLASVEISEDSLHEHLFLHHSITSDSLNLTGITLTDTDFRKMAGHPPYPLHIVDLDSFEMDWPQISAAFHGYATRTYVTEQTKLLEHAIRRDRASLSSELTKLYRNLMGDWELFGMEVRENAHSLPSEFIAFQNRLWTSRRLTWLAEQLRCLEQGTDVFLAFVQDQLLHFQ